MKINKLEKELTFSYIDGYRTGTRERLNPNDPITSSEKLNSAHFSWRSGYMDGWRQSVKKT